MAGLPRTAAAQKETPLRPGRPPNGNPPCPPAGGPRRPLGVSPHVLKASLPVWICPARWRYRKPPPSPPAGGPIPWSPPAADRGISPNGPAPLSRLVVLPAYGRAAPPAPRRGPGLRPHPRRRSVVSPPGTSVSGDGPGSAAASRSRPSASCPSASVAPAPAPPPLRGSGQWPQPLGRSMASAPPAFARLPPGRIEEENPPLPPRRGE